MFISKTSVIGAVSLLFVANIAFASPVKWKDLTAIQRDVLRSYALYWNDYSEAEQKRLLQKYSKEVFRKKVWKKWFNKKLTENDRKNFIENKKIMTTAQFESYVRTLFVKYGRPQ